MSGRILGRILQILGLIGLPTDLKLWYNILSAVVPAAAAGVFAYAQQASLPVLVLLVLGVYVVFFLASIPITAAISRLRSSGAADEIRLTEQAQTTIINYGHIQMNSVTGAERGDEPPLGGENVHEEEQLEVHHASELPRP
jgi:hypothetical protein